MGIGAFSLAAAMSAATVAPAKIDVAQAVEGTRKPLAAMNTLFGPTGLIKVPTAFVADHKAANVGASFGENFRGPSVNYGLIPYVEVGGAFLDRDNAKDKAIGNAKVTVIPANFNFFEVGIGVIDVADAVGRTYYVVGSADLKVPRRVESEAIGFRVHGGVGTGQFKERLIAGAELEFSHKFTLIGEWDSKDFNAALRYAHDEKFRIQAGFQHTSLFFGMTYAMQF